MVEILCLVGVFCLSEIGKTNWLVIATQKAEILHRLPVVFHKCRNLFVGGRVYGTQKN
nr:MAG TPA: hypothetical protein [Bacteriophage sp.]